MLGQFIFLTVIFGGLFLALHYGGEWIIRWETHKRQSRRH